MQVLVTALGQGPRLVDWERRPFWPAAVAGPQPGDRRGTYESVVAQERPGEPEPDGPHARVAHAIRAYAIFPPRLVSGVVRRAPVEAGDTVGIRYHFLPGLDFFFAARVLDCFDGAGGGAWRTGFTYRTLAGHPELGEETFAVEKDLAAGRVTVRLSSWSRPGTRLARACAPLVRRLQVQAGRAALAHLASIASGLKPSA